MMKIAIVGASGNAGSRITAELARRGHAVTAIARKLEKIASLENVTAKAGDLHDQPSLTRLLAGHDAAISSVHFLDSDPEKLIAAAKDSHVGRYLVVGGARRTGSADRPRSPRTAKRRSREGGGLPRSAPAGEGAELDLPVALGAVCRRRAHGQVPARNRPTPDRAGREKLGLV